MDLHMLLRLVVKQRASDLFITAGKPPCLKVDGRIVAVSPALLSPEQARQLVGSSMTPDQREEFVATRESNFALHAEGIGRFRVSAFVQKDQPGMVLRRIQTRVPTIEELGLPSILKDLIMTRRGLVLFAGATGTGKSTSLAAMIGYRNRKEGGHIISIEDPIEYIHEHDRCIITQREVGIDTESFEVALKNSLRQAPDVILIGEIRTRETVAHAVSFAETCHLCLSTVHANTASSTLERIINFFPHDCREQVLLDLSLNLRAVVSQQLVPRADGKGRIPVVEVLLNTPLVANNIRGGEMDALNDIIRRSTEEGMMTFDQGLFQLYRKGLISYEDALSYATSENEVRLMIKLDAGEEPEPLALEDLERIRFSNRGE